MCGRRFGKTILGISQAQETAIHGGSIGWFSPSYKYAVEPWDDLVHRLRPMAKDVSEQERRMVLLNGGVVDVWTCDHPDPGRGRFYDLVVIDEAGIIRNLDTIWEQAIRPTLVQKAGKALFLGTPKGRTHFFSQLFGKAQSETDWAAFRAPTSDNPYIPREEIERERRTMHPAIFAQEYEGIPADDGGNPFGLDAIKEAATLTSLEGEPVIWGWDFARAQDWTVGIAVDRSYRVVRFHRWQLKPWGETKADVKTLTKGHPAWGDSTGIGDVIVEDLQRAGMALQGYKFTPASKQQLMERLAAAIQQRLVKIPVDGPIRAELEAFGFEYTAHGVRYSAPEGLHDDCVMALALAVYGRDQYGNIPPPKGPIQHDDDTHPGFTEQGVRRPPWDREPEEAPRGWRNRGQPIKLSED